MTQAPTPSTPAPLTADALVGVTGGGSLAAHRGLTKIPYAAGYGLGWAVTQAIAPFDPAKAFQQVGAPVLRRHGLPNMADGAAAAVRDVGARYGHAIDERGERP